MELKEEVEYFIVGSTESDPANGRISNESPLGSVLLGKKSGEVVTVEAPRGHFKYKVLEIV